MDVRDLFPSAPPTWERTTLGEICHRGGGSIQTGPFGSQLHASDYVPFGIPSIMPTNIGDNRILSDGIARIRESDAIRLSKHRVQSGDVVYSRRGDVERRALVRDRESGWLCGTGCLKVRFGQGVINPAFASYYLGHPEIRSWIVRHAVGATMPNLNTAIMESIPFLLPPFSQQDQIARILSSLDDKIELNRQMNETLEAMARRLFKSWFVDFDPVHAKAALRREHPRLSNADLSRRALPNMAPEIAELFPDGFEESVLGRIPKGWKAGTVTDAIEVNPTRSLAKGTVAPWLEMSNMPTRSARALAWENREFGSGTKFINGDTLVARITPCLENGKTAFVDFLDDGQVGAGSTEYIVLRPKPSLPPVFAYLLARTEDFRQYLITNMTGTSGRQRVPADCLSKFPIVTPANHIADCFAKATTQIFAQMKVVDEESFALIRTRDRLLPQLLSGDCHA